PLGRPAADSGDRQGALVRRPYRRHGRAYSLALPAEVDALFSRIRALQERGIAFIYISHRIDEVMALSQRITVLKDDRNVGTVTTADTTASQLVAMMLGREPASYYSPYASPEEIGEGRKS